MSRPIQRSAAPADLASELARVEALPIDDARSMWLAMMRRPPSRELSGDMVRRMIAYHLQERTVGGLDRRLATVLDRLADGGATASRLRPGCVLVREHDGVLHQVMVLQTGFAWNGRTLPSLSAVAKAITGTAWNGNRFFGLDRGKKEKAGSAARANSRAQYAVTEASA